MTDLVERVAKEIAKRGYSAGLPPEDYWEDYMDDARAAITETLEAISEWYGHDRGIKAFASAHNITLKS